MTVTQQSLYTDAASDFTDLAAIFTNLASLTSDGTVTLPVTPVPAVDFGHVTCTVSATGVPIGATNAYVPVNLSRAVSYEVQIEVLTQNGTATQGSGFTKVNELLRFAPGETQKIVTIPLLTAGSEGLSFNLIFPTQIEPTVPGVTGVSGAITWHVGAVNPNPTLTPPTFPAVQKTGAVTFTLNLSTFAAKDGGDSTHWNTNLPGGNREQLGNQEPVVYTDSTLYTGTTPLRTDGTAVYLRAENLGTPITINGRTYHMGASVLRSDQMVNGVQQYGYYEASMKLPSVTYGWPGFWLYGHNSDEIDIMEVLFRGVNGYLVTDSNAAVHGTSYATSKLRTTWLLPPGIDLTTGYHRYAVDWRADWTTWYIDDIEVFRCATTCKDPLYILFDMTMGPGATTAPNVGNELAVQSLTVRA